MMTKSANWIKQLPQSAMGRRAPLLGNRIAGQARRSGVVVHYRAGGANAAEAATMDKTIFGHGEDTLLGSMAGLLRRAVTKNVPPPRCGGTFFFRACARCGWHTPPEPWQTLNHSEPALDRFWPTTCR